MQSINLQIAPGSVNPVINVSQNDVGRQFQLKLYDGAAAYTLPTGTTASIEGIKPDGHAFSYSDAVSVSGSILTVTTKLQMTVVAGRVICEIRLRKSGLDLGSLNFVMLVEESPINENVDPSDTEIPAIIELAEGQVEDAEAWARGTKNGGPVSSTDPQFQNNAKWYAEHVAASLDALSNVNISSPANEDVLEYNSATQKWKNSGAVRQLKQALSDEVATRGKLGAKNRLPLTLEGVKSLNTGGTWSGNTYTFHSVAFEVQTDSENNITGIKVNGTNDIASNIYFAIPKSAILNGTYIVTGCPSDVGSEVIWQRIGKGASSTVIGNDTGNGYTFSATGDVYDVTIFVGPSKTVSNKMLYPMIRLASDTDPTYQPYAMTNRELTEKKLELELTDLLTFPVTTFPANSSVTVSINNPSSRIPKAAFLANTSGMADGLAPVYVGYNIYTETIRMKMINVTDASITTDANGKVQLFLLF